MTTYTYTFLVTRIFLWCCIFLDSIMSLVTLRSVLFALSGKDLNNSITQALERPIEMLEKIQRLSGYAFLALMLVTFYALMRLLTWRLAEKNMTPRFGPLLSGLSWIIPILNVFRPPQVIAYLRDNLPITQEEGRKAFLYPNFLFWTLWWLSIATRTCLIFLSRANTSNMTMEQWADLAILQLACDAVTIFWLVLLSRMIGLFARKLSTEDSTNVA